MKAQIEYTKETIIDQSQPYLLKFEAEWCGPCKTFNPVMEEIAKEVRIKIYAVNVDKNSDIAQKYGIRGIPTTLLIKGEQVVGSLVGNHTKHEVLKLIEGNL